MFIFMLDGLYENALRRHGRLKELFDEALGDAKKCEAVLARLLSRALHIHRQVTLLESAGSGLPA